MKEVKNGKIVTLENAPVTTLEERIQRLEDIESIKEVIYHYARCVDNCDAEGVAAIYTDTGTLCNPRMGNPTGREAIRKAMEASFAVTHSKCSNHLMGNHQIWFKTRDCALMSCVLFAWQAFEGEPAPKDSDYYARYEAEMVRESDGEWRVQNFKLIFVGIIGENRMVNNVQRIWPPDPTLV